VNDGQYTFSRYESGHMTINNKYDRLWENTDWSDPRQVGDAQWTPYANKEDRDEIMSKLRGSNFLSTRLFVNFLDFTKDFRINEN